VPLKGALLLAFAVLGAGAYVLRTREWVVPSFTAAYVALILVTPWDGGPRYLIPIVPSVILFIAAPFYLFAAMLGTHHRPAMRVALAAGAIATLALPIWLASRTVAGARELRGFDDNQVATDATREMIEAVKSNSTPGEKVCSPKPRAVMYFAKRRGCVIPPQLPGSATAWLIRQEADLAMVFTSSDEPAYRRLDETMRQEPTLNEVFRNRDYAVYRRVTPTTPSPTERPAP
jgi:cytochrome c oxidase subunit 4